MAGLDPAIHDFLSNSKNVDARDKPSPGMTEKNPSRDFNK